MTSARTISLQGQYRVQSRRRAVRSAIAGSWLPRRRSLLNNTIVNRALRHHPLWRSGVVRLRPALIASRTGLFRSQPDILYKYQFFRRDAGSDPMTCDIVDVRKATRLWETRRQAVFAFLTDECARQVLDGVRMLETTVANEYFCHEAGHMLGVDVRTKYAGGYFRPAGSIAWPLASVEEFRADQHGFGFAEALLSGEEATSVFLYNIALRFGHEIRSAATDADGYGTVPLLLYMLLRELGVLEVVGRGASLAAALVVDLDELPRVMRECDAHIGRLTLAEFQTGDMIAAATAAAMYFRERMALSSLRKEYLRLAGAAASRLQRQLDAPPSVRRNGTNRE